MIVLDAIAIKEDCGAATDAIKTEMPSETLTDHNLSFFFLLHLPFFPLHRYGGIGVVEGCTSVVNPVTCEYEHYRIDDPSQRCIETFNLAISWSFSSHVFLTLMKSHLQNKHTDYLQSKCSSSGSGYFDKTFTQHFFFKLHKGILGADSLPTSERSAAPCASSLPRDSWVFPEAKMKVFFSLIIFSLILATCQGACFTWGFEAEIKDGKPVVPHTCLDRNDQREHLFGSTWNTADCLRCSCSKYGMHCCHRYGGISGVEGCTSVVNPMTCEYEHYKIDDPSQRCRV
ncbi:hypothetical protein E2320_006864 [Naja naja]|nr:hypothetical protein E2320_006864 [Naja naja]